jgi:hypothetical protein
MASRAASSEITIGVVGNQKVAKEMQAFLAIKAINA